MLELKPEGFRLADVVAQPVAVCGRQLVADNSGALYWPSQGTLLVADLKLGAGSDVFASHGAGNGTFAGGGAHTLSEARRTLLRLAEVMDRYDPARVIVLGDRADSGAAGMSADELEILRILQEEREWIWMGSCPESYLSRQLGGRTVSQLDLSGLSLRSQPTPGWATHEIGAHLRPAARLSMYGYTLRRACFVGNGRRLVMPAFGASTEGLNVLHSAFRALFPGGGMAVWMLGHEGLYPVATRFLAGD
jgi:metallophosphoesterase superfamily enzyme